MTTEQPHPEQEYIRNFVSELEEYKQTCIHKEMCKWMCTALKCPFHLISPFTHDTTGQTQKYLDCKVCEDEVRQDATEKVLVKILEKCNVECDTDTGQILAYQNISLDEVLDIFDSLRTKPEGT